MIKVLSLVGTRPEAVKMAPVIEELRRCSDRITSKVCVTAQHREMLDRVLELFEIIPNYDLDVMRENQTCSEVAAAIMSGLEPVLQEERPDWVLVQGDTTTVMSAALAAFHNGVNVGHVEAGLRTFDKHRPFPEEINRRAVALVADLHFAPTTTARRNLLGEGVSGDRVVVTGNSAIDAIRLVANAPHDRLSGPLAEVPPDRRLALVTAHRRESFGAPLQNICRALYDVVERFEDVHVVYAVHPNPRVEGVVRSMLADHPRITLTPPLDYLTLVQVMKSSYIVLTDSGGIQEEAPALGKPVIVLRDETERPEGVAAGAARLAGTSRARVRDEFTRLLTDDQLYAQMAGAVNPYGDGHAAPRIVDALLSFGSDERVSAASFAVDANVSGNGKAFHEDHHHRNGAKQQSRERSLHPMQFQPLDQTAASLRRRPSLRVLLLLTAAVALAVTALAGRSAAGAAPGADSGSLSTRSLEPTTESSIPNLRAPARRELVASSLKASRRFERQILGTAGKEGAAQSGTQEVDGAGASASSANTLVLYDTTGTWGWLGELYAMYGANLVSHFGAWTAKPVVDYTAGELEGYSAVLYIGSTYDEPLPTAFLDDVYNTNKPVVWIYDNIWELTARQPNFQAKYGWSWWQFDTSSISSVVYKGRSLTRYAPNAAGIMSYSFVDPAKASVVGEAVRANGTRFPWALRSGNLTYVGENPFTYTSESDRFLVFADLLFDALAPTTPVRHRALVRIEDISPTSDPAELRAIADTLSRAGVPFGFGVSPRFEDPHGVLGGPTSLQLRNAGAVASAIRYMQSKGGVLVEHGYTHQYRDVANPYNAVSGDDFEFYRVTENPDHSLTYVGPVPEDTSTAWTDGRITAANAEFAASGVSQPTIFEFPHYAASANGYRAVAGRFSTRWERTLYFSGVLRGGAVDHSRFIGQMLPYNVRDVYGTVVLPENLGSYEPDWFFIFPPRPVSAILADASRNLVVRDGFASFYFHPFYPVSVLRQIVNGIKSRGYTFVSPTAVAGG